MLAFLKHEKLYIFLLVFIILFQLSLSFFNQLLVDTGPDEIFKEESLKDEEIISEERIKELLGSDSIIYLIFLFLLVGFVFFVIIGIALDIIYLHLKRKNISLIHKTQIIETGRWNFWDICKVAIIFLFVQRIIWLADLLIFSGVPYLYMRSNRRLILFATLADIVGIAAIFYFVLKERQHAISSLGLTARRFFVNIRYGAFAYVGLIPILASVMFLTMTVFKVFNIPIEPQPILLILRKENHLPTLIYMGFFTAILGPV